MGGLLTTGRLLRLRRARRNSVGRPTAGFTIVEVMIVLAVSGAMFVAAAILISGKQNQAAFNQAIQQMQSQIQQAMNEVATGYFPSNANFKCTAPAGGPVTLSNLGAAAQGANAGCVFAGKVVQFKIHDTNPEEYATFTLAGAQKDSTGKEAGTLAGSVPKVVAPGTASPANFPNLTTTTVLQNGLAVAVPPAAPGGMWYNDGGADVYIGAVAFVPSFAKYTGSIIDSGSQQLSVVAVGGTTLNATKQATADAINANIAGASSVVNPAKGVFICFATGGPNESGLVTIGGSSHPLSVTLKVMQGTQTCGK